MVDTRDTRLNIKIFSLKFHRRMNFLFRNYILVIDFSVNGMFKYMHYRTCDYIILETIKPLLCYYNFSITCKSKEEEEKKFNVLV